MRRPTSRASVARGDAESGDRVDDHRCSSDPRKPEVGTRVLMRVATAPRRMA